MASNEETNAAGTDTRPPMLVDNDYESWKIRIHSTAKEFWENVGDAYAKDQNQFHDLLCAFPQLVNDRRLLSQHSNSSDMNTKLSTILPGLFGRKGPPGNVVNTCASRQEGPMLAAVCFHGQTYNPLVQTINPVNEYSSNEPNQSLIMWIIIFSGDSPGKNIWTPMQRLD
ncbi:hypothetical protein Tco_0765805 [Tanacetum coccineum]